MEKQETIEILNRINSLLLKNATFEARDYINLELDNLKGITSKNCKGAKLNFCKSCSNLNCNKK